MAGWVLMRKRLRKKVARRLDRERAERQFAEPYLINAQRLYGRDNVTIWRSRGGLCWRAEWPVRAPFTPAENV